MAVRARELKEVTATQLMLYSESRCAVRWGAVRCGLTRALCLVPQPGVCSYRHILLRLLSSWRLINVAIRQASISTQPEKE